MKTAFGFRLKTQLIIVFMTLMTGLMVAFCLIVFRRVEQVVETQSADLNQQYFEQNEYSILNYTKQIDELALKLSQTDGVPQYLETGWVPEKDVIQNAVSIFQNMRSMITSHDEIDSVFFYGDGGTVIGIDKNWNFICTGEDRKRIRNLLVGSRIQKEVEERNWVTYWTGGYRRTDFMDSNTYVEDYRYITAARSVNQGARHIGVVLINIREPWINDLLITAGEEKERKTFIMDETGMIISSDDTEKIGEYYPQKSLIEDAASDSVVSDGVQINYRRISGEKAMNWILVSTIPIRVLNRNTLALRKVFALVTLGSLLAGGLIAVYFLRRITQPLDQLRYAMQRVQTFDLGTQLEQKSSTELGLLGAQFNQMSQSLEEMVRQIHVMENEKRDLEENALQRQINPHFLFNTLSNIKYMAVIVQSETIADCITALGNILAPIYRSEQKEWSCQDEMEYLQNYIKIMNYRFGGKIRVDYHIDLEDETAQMLRFILQPVLENSIAHGFAERGGEGKIDVRIREKEGMWNITVSDNGDGMTREELETLRRRISGEDAAVVDGHRKHIGLRNVQRRLQLNYGEAYGLRVESTKREGTVVTMVFPTALRSAVDLMNESSAGQNREPVT